MEEKEQIDEMVPVYLHFSKGNMPGVPVNKDEYKAGHQKPPLFLIILYVIVIFWCAISWIPFYGY